MGPLDPKRPRFDNDERDDDSSDEEPDAAAEVYLPTRPLFDQVVINSADTSVLNRQVVRTILFPVDALVEAFLFVMADTATVAKVWEGIKTSMMQWGCKEEEVPSMTTVANTLYQLVLKNERIVVINNSTPPYDAIYALQPSTRASYSNLILTPVPVNIVPDLESAVKLLTTLTAIRRIMFPYVNRE